MMEKDQAVHSEEKFSLIAFAHHWKVKQQQRSDHHTEKKIDSNDEAFQRVVDDIRSELVKLQGRTEDEHRKTSEMINRAVLGFERERSMMLTMIQDMLIKKRIHDELLPKRSTYETLAEAIFAEVIGLSVLELVLKGKDDLEEVQVIGPLIFEVRGGVEYLSPYRFHSVKDVERVQQNLVLFNKDVLNQKKKWAEVMLSDGSRVTMTGFGYTSEPTLTIRFFNQHQYNLQKLCRPPYESLDEHVVMLLRTVIAARFNIVIIGATNTGKTHLIKSMIAELPSHERIVTIETQYEMNLKQQFPEKNIIEYVIDDDDPLHSGRQAFKLALRQSPKRIIHAEIRDEDANIYVRACTRGHEGSMTTVHVNELEDAPDAIVDMCMLDGRGMNPERLRRRITEYVTQIGIEMAIVNGKRKLVRLAEFMLVNDEITTRNIATYDRDQDRWVLGETFSKKASQKIAKQAREAYEHLLTMQLVQHVC